MLEHKYLKEQHLKGFDKYKYNCIDTSVLSRYVMHPFWNFCVQFCPMNLAPNLITFIGFLLTIVNFLLIGYYDYDFTASDSNSRAPIPSWVWIVASINIFVAYTLDGVDGKQARRTGTSSPLGELFDHGVDSYSAALIPIYVFSIFGREQLSTTHMFFIVWNVFLNFFLTHFEKYNTGVLFLPWAYDFTMWGVTIVLLITGIFGTALWDFQLPFNLSPARAFEIFLYVSGMLSSHPFIIYHIYRSYKDKSGKMRPFMEAIRPLQPFVGMFIITSVWILFSPNGICDLEPRLLFLLFGTVFSNICCRLIVAQMSDTRTDGWNDLLWLILGATILSVTPWRLLHLPILPAVTERYVVIALTVLATVVHFHYGQGVVREMCEHFKIRCFKVSYPRYKHEK